MKFRYNDKLYETYKINEKNELLVIAKDDEILNVNEFFNIEPLTPERIEEINKTLIMEV